MSTKVTTYVESARSSQKITRRLIIIVGSFLLVGTAFLIALQSTLSPWNIHYPGEDSSLFIYAGSQIIDGIIPYRDILTYNGPIVFLISALGQLFGGETTLWYIEIFLLSATFLVLFYSLTQHIGPLSALIVCLSIAAIIPSIYDGGNNAEQYTLFFQAVGVAGFLNYFKLQRFTPFSVYLIGLGASFAFLTEPFTLLFWSPLFFITLARVLHKEGVYTALTRMIAIIIGFFIPFVIVVPWLNINHALESCLNQTIVFYINHITLVSLKTKIDTFVFFATSLPFLLTVFISLAVLLKTLQLNKKKAQNLKEDKTELDCVGSAGLIEDGKASSEAKKKGSSSSTTKDTVVYPFGPGTPFLIIANLLSAVLLYAAMALPGNQEGHVLLQGLICLVIPLAYVVQFSIKSLYAKSLIQLIPAWLFMVLLLVFVWIPGYARALETTKEQSVETADLQEQRELVDAINTYKAETGSFDDPIVVFGNNCWAYTATNSYSATRYACQTFSNELRADLNQSFYNQIGIAANSLDSLLLVGKTDDGRIEQYPLLSEYKQVFRNNSYELYQKRPKPTMIAERDSQEQAERIFVSDADQVG